MIIVTIAGHPNAEARGRQMTRYLYDNSGSTPIVVVRAVTVLILAGDPNCLVDRRQILAHDHDTCKGLSLVPLRGGRKQRLTSIHDFRIEFSIVSPASPPRAEPRSIPQKSTWFVDVGNNTCKVQKPTSHSLN